MNRRNFILQSIALACTAGQTGFALAQTGAGRTTILVGFPAGGTPDLIARLVAEHLRSAINRTVIVENRSGGAGVIAVQAALAASPAGGTTLIVLPVEMLTLYPHTQKSLPYDPLKDLVPVASLVSSPFCIATASMAPSKTIAEFAAWCRANPGKATFGTPGVNTPQHLIGLQFARAAGIELQHIPYRGGAPALQDLLGGQIAAVISVAPLVVQQHKSGSLTVIGTTGAARSPSLPDVATLSEQGFPAFIEDSVMALYAPAKAAPGDFRDIAAAVQAYVRTEDFAKAVGKFGQLPRPRSDEEHRRDLRSATARWGEAVAKLGLKPAE